LRHVLWIGGPGGAGKTTIAKRLARRHGLRWYSADAHTWTHRDRAIRAGNEAAIRWEAMTPEERWVSATPAEMLELSLTFDRWTMIADDLRKLPRAPLVVAEGTTVVPDLVAAGLADAARAVWLAPTDGLLRTRLAERRTTEKLGEYCLLAATEIARRTAEHGVNVVRMDGSRTVDESVADVEMLFAQALAEGPRAESATARRTLLRYANDAVVEQALGYLARPWSEGDPETFVRDFVCECDDPECDAVARLPVAAFVRAAESGRVVADAHA
jgi:hypothetical protein